MNWDRAILHVSPVCLFYREPVLREAIDWLGEHRYVIHAFEASQWAVKADFHDSLKKELAFPDYYGRNLDALLDCLRGLEIPLNGGVALVFRRYDAFKKADEAFAQSVLDVLAHASYEHLVDGRRLLTLVQSDDPAIHFDPVGQRSVVFNSKEWLNKTRGL
jgi:RNAse (barnase) inhibitor barstar